MYTQDARSGCDAYPATNIPTYGPVPPPARVGPGVGWGEILPSAITLRRPSREMPLHKPCSLSAPLLLFLLPLASRPQGRPDATPRTILLASASVARNAMPRSPAPTAACPFLEFLLPSADSRVGKPLAPSGLG